MAYATRKKLVSPIFGASEELPNNVLPTYLNVMKYYNEIKRFLAFTKKIIIRVSPKLLKM